MVTNMFPLPINSLSDVIFQKVSQDDCSAPENVSDKHLSQAQHELALSGYLRLESITPRVVAKIAYCEWMTGHYDDARKRLVDYSENLDADGVGLLSKLISIDRDYKRSEEDEKLIWPRLKAVTSASTVPLVAVFARFQRLWPEDACNPKQRLQDIEYLLSLYPSCQPLRLAVLIDMQDAGISADEQYAFLHTFQYPSLMPRYLWIAASIAAKAGKFNEALDYLSQLETYERRNDSTSQQVLWEIELARCDIQAKTNAVDPLSGFVQLSNDASYTLDTRIIASRAALAVACQMATDQIQELADNFVDLLVSDKYGATFSALELVNESEPFTGDHWDNYVLSWSGVDLRPYKELLISTLQGRALRFFRAVSVTELLDNEYELTESTELSTDFWDNLAEILGDVTPYPEEFDGKLLSLYTVIHSHRDRPNWAKIGQYWIISEWLAYQKKCDLSYSWLITEIVGNDTDSTRKFALGTIKYLKKQSIPSPTAYDLVQELVGFLVEYRQCKELYQLMTVISAGDERVHVQFYLGWSSQEMGYKPKAISAYKKVLLAEPEHYSAIFNMLLLCTTQFDGPLLEKLEQHVIQFSGNEDKKQKLTDGLARARKRCEDKNAAKKQIIAEYLSEFPPLLEHSIKPEDISLRVAVALLALYRCANAEPDDIELTSLDESSLSFSPVISNRSILFNLLNSGLASIHADTSLDAFPVADGEVTGVRFGAVRWRMSQSCETLIGQLRTLNGNIPEHWHKELLPFAREIAQGEIVEYLGSLAKERKWPEPRNTENLADLTRELVNELSVAQAFYLAYLGAMSASDYKQKYPVSAQQAADVLVKRTGDRLESVRSGRFSAQPYDRPWKVPRSAVSFVLWGTLLNRGDDGFTQRVADLIASI
ncbi:hypothetical protein CSN78_002454 [Salmonella enterica subsp. diarizonae]|uniref:hypothetical protein n=1 Tax=Salmonella enterica TaxID=28901 RepID=UPI0012854A6D|nr:hypothetical protein [Salmonella enterica]ECC1573905.1 hypothetical protein [Salmonella enterica subsp. diarizonae]EBA7038416.1 hypothetical protein [Salmonella enterica]ECO7559553.1 hypothetical protein [Salmonella enterica]EDJ9765779.1 hypothetical protein [Salmonella enterica]EDT8784877.1 hypothetical protein [Salmonella enterica subsp. diarizonae]